MIPNAENYSSKHASREGTKDGDRWNIEQCDWWPLKFNNIKQSIQVLLLGDIHQQVTMN
jgi:hypothetical protein